MKTTNFNTVDSSPKFINSGMRNHIYKYEKSSDFNLPKLKQMNNNNQAQKLKFRVSKFKFKYQTYLSQLKFMRSEPTKQFGEKFEK